MRLDALRAGIDEHDDALHMTRTVIGTFIGSSANDGA
jgi:hypothetical protein